MWYLRRSWNVDEPFAKDNDVRDEATDSMATLLGAKIVMSVVTFRIVARAEVLPLGVKYVAPRNDVSWYGSAAVENSSVVAGNEDGGMSKESMMCTVPP